MQVFYPAAPLQ